MVKKFECDLINYEYRKPNKTSISENYISKKTPKKVNIDVLKRKIYEQQKKEKMVGRIAIFTFFSFICVIGFIISA